MNDIRPLAFPKQSFFDLAMRKVGGYNLSEQGGSNPQVGPYFGESIFSGRHIALGYWKRQYDEWIKLVKNDDNPVNKIKQ